MNPERARLGAHNFIDIILIILQTTYLFITPKDSSINDVTVLEGGGGQRFCDGSSKAFVIKSVTMGERVSKIFQNCMTSFMDDP